MGMFDYVDAPPVKCKCGGIVSGWQTKDLSCEMKTVPIDNLLHFYSYCYDCGTWVQFDRKLPKATIEDFELHIEDE